MRDRSPNKPIGTVECPHKGCTESCQVFKFRARSETRTRFAGLLYADCPQHGRFGSDGRPAMQEYILEHATMHGPTDTPAKTAPAPSKPPEKIPSPSGAPAPAKGAETGIARPWWDKLRTALD